VNRIPILILFSFFFLFKGKAQVSIDSLASVVLDTKSQGPDTFSLRPRPDTGMIQFEQGPFSLSRFTRKVLGQHPYFGFNSKPVVSPASEARQVDGKELMFYLLVFLLILFALLRRAFPKYFYDLFRLFFRTTLKQRQIREQLMQTPLPSLLLNIFFMISGGLYITFVLEHYDLNPVGNFWLLALYCTLGLAAAYFVKFIGLKISGWLFNMEEAADSYIFVIFIVNKMLGIMLLPFLVLLAFTTGNLNTASLTLSWCFIGALIIYRFILTYAAIRNEVKVNPFHFFLYICAFEIAPLLLVYKGLLLFFPITA
jgi:hypothetical protein